MTFPARFRWMMIPLISFALGRVQAQTTASFNFSAASQPVTGWVNIAGDPSTAVRSGTSNGITISSIAISNWSPLSGVGSAFDGVGAAGGTFFPAAVLLNHWFQAGAAGNFNTAIPQLLISGLIPGSVYTIQMAGSSTSTSNTNPTQYAVAGTTMSAFIDVNNHNNTANGAVFSNIAPDSAGHIRVYVNTVPTTDVGDIGGIQITAGQTGSGGTGSGGTIGDGLGQNAAGAISLGDTVTGSGPHNFTANRYEFLNGHVYSIGGTVNDPIARPDFRVYNNGDLAAGLTMDTSVHSVNQNGFLYYSKLGVLQLGGSDKLDTTGSKYAVSTRQGTGILMNSDFPNFIKGRLYNSYFAGEDNTVDSGLILYFSIVAGESMAIKNYLGKTLIMGYNHFVSSPLTNSFVNGAGNQFVKPCYQLTVNGGANFSADSATASLIQGTNNQFGGLAQLVAGNNLVNRTPYGTVLGNANVDFTTLAYTGLRGIAVPATIAQYPLFTLGNSSNGPGVQVRSNALTVLFNGRTQINTTGYTNSLTQANVTPKAALEVVSTNTGVLLPKLTTTQRNAIATADLQNGLLLYNTDSSSFQFYNGASWTSVGSGTGNSGRWQTSAGLQYDSADNIGIGTSNTQGYKLAVNGTAIFTQIKVKPAGSWPDYVFSQRYELPGLAQLEKYIALHKHLPGILSEAEVRRSGIDLGDQQAVLLKKIEELTLYLIRQNNELKNLRQQQEKIEQQNRVITEQEERISRLERLMEQKSVTK